MRDDLLRPSGAALVGVLLVFLGWWVAAAALVRPEVLVGLDEGWVLAGPDDDHTRLSLQVMRLARRPYAERTVLVLGPSSTREAITSGEDLEARVRARSGDDEVGVELLAADGETPFEYAAILGALPDGFRGVVVLATSPSMLARCFEERLGRLESRQDLALGWISPDRDAELRRAGVEVGRRTGLYLWDARDFLLPRAMVPLARLAGRGASYEPHRSGPPFVTLEDSIRMTAGKIAHYGDGAKVALPVLERAMDTFAARSTEVRFVLLEQTELPGEYAEVVGPKRMSHYQRRMARFTIERRDAWLLDLNGTLRPGDFADLVHLSTDAGRTRYTEALAIWLGDLLAGREPSAEAAVRGSWHPAPASGEETE